MQLNLYGVRKLQYKDHSILFYLMSYQMLIIVSNIYVVLRTLTAIDDWGLNYSTLHEGYETEWMETRAGQCSDIYRLFADVEFFIYCVCQY